MPLADPAKTGTAGAPENEASRLASLAHHPALRNARLALLPPLRATYRTPWPKLPTRLELGPLLNARRLLGEGAEVGVRDGYFSEVILDRWKGRRLLSIDAWREFPTEEYVDRSNVEDAVHEQNLATTRERLARFGARSQIVRAASVEAAADVADGSLDFVYLDARHDRDGVMEDLEAWTPKVRAGGLISGHDYVDGLFLDGVFGVRSAVDEFCAARGWRVRASWGDPPWTSWYAFARR